MSTRKPLREEIYQMVLSRLLRADLQPGSRVNESWLAAELSVSRTPLREALFRLEQEGFVRSEQARGFVVMPLTAREVRELYPILWTLEGLALRSAGLEAASDAALLSQINADFVQEENDPARSLEMDTRWHQTLLQRCPNRHLLSMIGSLKQVVSRYEWAYMRDLKLRAISFQQHQGITEAVVAGEMERAVSLLQDHWRTGMDALLQRLDWL